MLQPTHIFIPHAKETPGHVVPRRTKSAFFESVHHPMAVHPTINCCSHNGSSIKIQRKSVTGQEPAAGIQLQSYLNGVQGQGHRLSQDIRKYYEPKFGYDFGDVEIHNDPPAYKSSASINALAYAYGNHIVFGEGQFQPGTKEGNKILAHELTHVVQQRTKNFHSVQRLVRKTRVNNCKDEVDNPVSDLAGAEQVAFTFLQKAIRKIQNAEAEYAEAVHKYFTPDLDQLKNYKNAMQVARHLRTAFGFSPADPETWDKLRIIRARFMKTISYLDSVVFDYNCCKADEECPKAGGHKCPEKRIAFTRAEDNPTLIILCPGFWGSANAKGLTLAHEVIHLWSKGFLKDTTTEVFGIKKDTPKFLDVYRYENFLRLLNT